MYVLSCLSHVWHFVTLWVIVCQAPLSMGFSLQEYWSGLLYPPPGNLPNPGIVPISLMSVWIGRQVPYHMHHLGSPTELHHPLKALSLNTVILGKRGCNMWVLGRQNSVHINELLISKCRCNLFQLQILKLKPIIHGFQNKENIMSWSSTQLEEEDLNMSSCWTIHWLCEAGHQFIQS